MNWNHESYLHIEPYYSRVGTSAAGATWWNWNNPYSYDPMFAPGTYTFTLNNLTSGGMHIGDVTDISSPVAGCTTGNHVHQESDSDGSYAPGLYFGKPLTNRFSDVHYVLLSGITGSAP